MISLDDPSRFLVFVMVVVMLATLAVCGMIEWRRVRRDRRIDRRIKDRYQRGGHS